MLKEMFFNSLYLLGIVIVASIVVSILMIPYREKEKKESRKRYQEELFNIYKEKMIKDMHKKFKKHDKESK